MKPSIIYIIIFAFTLCNSLCGQEKRVWTNAEEIQQFINYHKEQVNADSTIYFLDELIDFHKNRQNETALLNSYVKKISNLLLFNKHPEAFQLALSVASQYCQENDEVENCKVCGKVYLHLGALMVTMQDFRQGIKYLDMVCEEQEDLLFYHQKANLYCLLELPDSALMVSEKGIVWAKKSRDSKNIISAYNNHGIIARDLNKFDKAISAFSGAIEVIDSTGKNILDYAYVMGNLGSCYDAVGEYDKAYECLLIDAEGSVEYPAKGSYVQAELLLAEIEISRKEHKKVIKRLKNLLNNYEKHLSVLNKLVAYEYLMNTYNAIGNKDSYKRYSKKWITLNKFHFQNQMGTHKTLIEQFNSNALKQVTQKIELEKQLVDQKLIIQQKVSEQKQVKNWVLIGVLLVAILVGLLLFLRFKAIQAKKASIKDSDLKLAVKEQEILALKVQEENKNVKELSHELLVKQDFATSLIKQLDQLENISKPELKSIEFFIQNELDVKSTRVQLLQQMGDLSNNFYNELKISHSDMTELELKLAAMVVMQMSNKEIAISSNITLESAKKSKNRLKKRLALQPTDDLTLYLKGFL